MKIEINETPETVSPMRLVPGLLYRNTRTGAVYMRASFDGEAQGDVVVLDKHGVRVIQISACDPPPLSLMPDGASVTLRQELIEE